MPQTPSKRVLIAGATGYLGKYAVKAFKERGYWVRVLSRSKEKLFEPGPFTAPALSADDMDDIFIAEISKPETLAGVMDGIDIVCYPEFVELDIEGQERTAVKLIVEPRS